ncbi:PLC-like phosphodiesterase [Trametes coccinea BRFM310]|uniref:PLC-like phosphodiesterase n=1 Tax=Trametes coccinea (strain BRFM310) TaxID=1353009 RepID=A0A1Y2IJE8_TRAC3|nr:PLC-like phosphodiesterase [Trametes coccinea BRFM310]
MRVASFVSCLAAVVASVRAATVPSKRATVCNGHAELCNRSYGNVTFLGAHDSFAFSEDPLALSRDQELDIPSQLGLGVRLLQAQSHINDGVLHFCHTSCLLFDGGTVEDYLKKVHDFLTANPNEVLTLLFTNPDGASLPDLWDPAFQASGVADFAYVPPQIPVKQSDWPTLGEMIDSGKRVVVFLDAGADTDRSVPYILPEFPMIWETPFSVTDPNFPCSVDRISGPLSTEDHMYMINHSLNKNLLDTGIIVSDPKDAPTTNSVDSITKNAAGCEQFAAGRAPNFVLLDFVNLGNGLDAVNQLNGLA